MNNKKMFIFIIILVIVAITACAIYLVKKQDKKDNYTTINSLDNKFSINMPNTINYKINTNPSNDFTIDLYSDEDEMFMYATTIEKKREIDLYTVANDDKTLYFKDKENIREDTGITETKVNGNKAYQYSLIYFDKAANTDFFCHIVWIENENNIYVLNFEVSNKNAEKYKEKFIDIQNSFVII